MINVAEASAVAIYQTCWQTPDFSDPCCRIQLRPYPRKRGFTESFEISGAPFLILVLVTMGLAWLSGNSNWNQDHLPERYNEHSCSQSHD